MADEIKNDEAAPAPVDTAPASDSPTSDAPSKPSKPGRPARASVDEVVTDAETLLVDAGVNVGEGGKVVEALSETATLAKDVAVVVHDAKQLFDTVKVDFVEAVTAAPGIPHWFSDAAKAYFSKPAHTDFAPPPQPGAHNTPVED